jgi:hypothetical protein
MQSFILWFFVVSPWRRSHRITQKSFKTVFPLADFHLVTLVASRSKRHFARPSGFAALSLQPELAKTIA